MRVTVGRTSVLSLQLLVLIGLTAFGCKEKPSQALLTETTPQLNAPSRTPRAPAAQDDTLDDMAAQTERDVDFLLAHQREDGSIGVEAASTPGAVETTPAPKPQPAPPPPPRKVVVWNDAPQRLPATDLPNPAADTAATADPDPTPDDLPPAFPDSGQGNLFRDPPAPVEVQDMKQAGPSAGDPALSADQLRVLAVELRKELHKRKAWSDQPVREVLAMAMLSIIDP